LLFAKCASIKVFMHLFAIHRRRRYHHLFSLHHRLLSPKCHRNLPFTPCTSPFHRLIFQRNCISPHATQFWNPDVWATLPSNHADMASAVTGAAFNNATCAHLSHPVHPSLLQRSRTEFLAPFCNVHHHPAHYHRFCRSLCLQAMFHPQPARGVRLFGVRSA
jgi:hypothetical protein